MVRIALALVLLYSNAAEARGKVSMRDYKTCLKAFGATGEKQSYNGRRAIKKVCGR